MFRYKAHGLCIKSSIKFPELLEEEFDDLNSDLTIEIGKIDYSKSNIFSEGIFRVSTRFVRTKDSIFLIWNEINVCEISNGNRIIVNFECKIEDNFLRAIILGPAFGILLHQQGRLVLHASVIEVNGGAAAFIGDNSMGKSTTIVAFSYHGHPLIADDVLSIEFDDNLVPWVFSSFPRIKLWPESIELFLGNSDQFPRVHSESEKRSCHINNFKSVKLPLKWIYIIERDKKLVINNLSPKESLIELIRNSYCANIFKDTDEFSNLSQYANIVKHVKIKTLNIVDSLEGLDLIVKLVETDVLK